MYSCGSIHLRLIGPRNELHHWRLAPTIPTMKRLASLTLLAFVLAAITKTLTAAEHDFAKWEKEISAFETADKTSPPPKGALLFIGSSTVRMWKTMAEDLPGHQVINRGFGGSEIEDATHFADRIIFPYEPKMVLLRAGGN